MAAITLLLWTRVEYDRVIGCGILREGHEVELVGGAIMTVAAPIGYGYRQRFTFGMGERVTSLAFQNVSIAIDDLLPRVSAD